MSFLKNFQKQGRGGGQSQNYNQGGYNQGRGRGRGRGRGAQFQMLSGRGGKHTYKIIQHGYQDQQFIPNRDDNGIFLCQGPMFKFDTLSKFKISATQLKYHHVLQCDIKTQLTKMYFNNEKLIRIPNLEYIVKKCQGPCALLAGELYNHNFYWNCLSVTQNDLRYLASELHMKINSVFDGGVQGMLKEFNHKAMEFFGSGWIWLVAKRTDPKDKKQIDMKIMCTKEGKNPLALGYTPLLGIDLWEHAYYDSFRNNKKAYMDAIINCINWGFVSKQYDNEFVPKMMNMFAMMGGMGGGMGGHGGHGYGRGHGYGFF